MGRTSCSTPVTLLQCVNTTRRVRRVSAARTPSGVTRPSGPGCTSVSGFNPARARSLSGRSTELCSSSVATA